MITINSSEKLSGLTIPLNNEFLSMQVAPAIATVEGQNINFGHELILAAMLHGSRAYVFSSESTDVNEDFFVNTAKITKSFKVSDILEGYKFPLPTKDGWKLSEKTKLRPIYKCELNEKVEYIAYTSTDFKRIPVAVITLPQDNNNNENASESDNNTVTEAEAGSISIDINQLMAASSNAAIASAYMVPTSMLMLDNGQTPINRLIHASEPRADFIKDLEQIEELVVSVYMSYDLPQRFNLTIQAFFAAGFVHIAKYIPGKVRFQYLIGTDAVFDELRAVGPVFSEQSTVRQMFIDGNYQYPVTVIYAKANGKNPVVSAFSGLPTQAVRAIPYKYTDTTFYLVDDVEDLARLRNVVLFDVPKYYRYMFRRRFPLTAHEKSIVGIPGQSQRDVLSIRPRTVKLEIKYPKVSIKVAGILSVYYEAIVTAAQGGTTIRAKKTELENVLQNQAFKDLITNARSEKKSTEKPKPKAEPATPPDEDKKSSSGKDNDNPLDNNVSEHVFKIKTRRK